MSIVLSFRGPSSSASPAAATQVTAKRPGIRIGQKVVSALWAWKTRLRNRAELRALMERADDRMLADVGLTSSQVADEAGHPFWQG